MMLDREVAEAMTELETVAKEHGHAIGSWYRRSEQIWLTSCTRCQRLGWIMRPGFEPWRPGGSVLEETCEEQ